MGQAQNALTLTQFEALCRSERERRDETYNYVDKVWQFQLLFWTGVILVSITVSVRKAHVCIRCSVLAWDFFMFIFHISIIFFDIFFKLIAREDGFQGIFFTPVDFRL